MIVSGKVRVNACSFVLVGDESVIVAWSRVGVGVGGVGVCCSRTVGECFVISVPVWKGIVWGVHG